MTYGSSQNGFIRKIENCIRLQDLGLRYFLSILLIKHFYFYSTYSFIKKKNSYLTNQRILLLN